MNLQEIIQGLINSENDEGCSTGLVLVEKKWVNNLKKYLNEYKKTEEKTETEKDLRERREEVADKNYGETDDLEDLEVCDSDEWVIDGDRWIKKVYFVDGSDDKIMKNITFIVTFKKNTSKIIDTHINF